MDGECHPSVNEAIEISATVAETTAIPRAAQWPVAKYAIVEKMVVATAVMQRAIRAREG
jgi:hypothetical protein